ncbi:MAG: hypothetical protein K0R71_541 [Bacillales bacterium]|jgi:hypothetical protein|nr:hypothetical protein [Bacillales bacterium]
MKTILVFLLQTIKLFGLFLLFSLIFYFAINWFNEEYQGMRKYDEPTGEAVKVYSPSVGKNTKSNFVDRLLLYYLDGE